MSYPPWLVRLAIQITHDSAIAVFTRVDFNVWLSWDDKIKPSKHPLAKLDWNWLLHTRISFTKKKQSLHISSSNKQIITEMVIYWWGNRYSSYSIKPARLYNDNTLWKEADYVYSECAQEDVYNRAATCDFQQCGIFTSVESNKPVQPHFKLRNSKWCSVSSSTHIEYASDLQRLLSDCAYAQAGLSLCWSHIPHCWKSRVVAQYFCQSYCLQ